MNLYDIRWEHSIVADIRSPSRQIVTVYRCGDGLYSIFVGKETGIGGYQSYMKAWANIDALTAQCILFELWARRNWYQRLWDRVRRVWWAQ